MADYTGEFKYNPDYLNLADKTVTSASGEIYSEQQGISQEQIEALNRLAEEVITSTRDFDSLTDVAQHLPSEDADYFVPGANVSEVPSYLRQPLSGDIPSGDPDEYDPRISDPYYNIQDKPTHPGSFEEYSGSQSTAGWGKLSKKDLVASDLKKAFIIGEFPESHGDVTAITGSKKIQADILARADEYSQSNVDAAFRSDMQREYSEKIDPILKSLEYIDSPSDYEKTLNVLNKMKPAKEEPVQSEEKVYSDEKWASVLGLSSERQSQVEGILTPNQKKAFEEYKASIEEEPSLSPEQELANMYKSSSYLQKTAPLADIKKQWKSEGSPSDIEDWILGEFNDIEEHLIR